MVDNILIPIAKIKTKASCNTKSRRPVIWCWPCRSLISIDRSHASDCFATNCSTRWLTRYTWSPNCWHKTTGCTRSTGCLCNRICVRRLKQNQLTIKVILLQKLLIIYGSNRIRVFFLQVCLKFQIHLTLDDKHNYIL